MQRFLADWKSHEPALSPELSELLISGFVEENGCVFLAAGSPRSTATRDHLHDDSGYEPGQEWISDDLEGYLDEGIAVFD